MIKIGTRVCFVFRNHNGKKELINGIIQTHFDGRYYISTEKGVGYHGVKETDIVIIHFEENEFSEPQMGVD